MLSWKKAHSLVDDEFFRRLAEYDPIGPKPDEFKAYQIINYLRDYIGEV
jgi:hypothetical protein